MTKQNSNYLDPPDPTREYGCYGCEGMGPGRGRWYLDLDPTWQKTPDFELRRIFLCEDHRYDYGGSPLPIVEREQGEI